MLLNYCFKINQTSSLSSNLINTCFPKVSSTKNFICLALQISFTLRLIKDLQLHFVYHS